MAGRIPQEFINDLLTRVNIIELIDQRVGLKRTGHNYKACCPFHNEKTPSFTVSEPKQFYHCFGCGANGNAVSFLMEYDRLEFVDAIEELAQSVGMEVPREAQAHPTKKIDPNVYELLEKTSHYYQSQLKKHPQAKAAIEYLKGRGLDGKTAKYFGVGYAPPDWRNLQAAFGQSHGITKTLIEAGLLIEKDKDNAYDRFRDRITFPIRDRRGRVIGFGGRIINEGEPKYLNSPETTVFHKGQELYGFYEARQQNRQLNNVLIVEGYMDVIALAQFGVTNAVATLGTATSQAHLQQLFRATSMVTFCFDGDRAGRAAAMKAIDHALPLLRGQRQIKLMFLPDGDDPDTLIRRIGEEEFRQTIAAAEPLFDFLLNHLCSQVDLNSVAGRSHLIHLAQPYLEKLTDSVHREVLVDALAEKSGLAAEKILRLLEGSERPAFTPGPAPSETKDTQRTAPRTDSRVKVNPVRTAIQLILQNPALAEHSGPFEWLKTLPVKGTKLLYTLLDLLKKDPTLTTGALIEHWRGQPQEAHLAKLAMLDREVVGDEQQEFTDCMQRLLGTAREERLAFLQRKASDSRLNDREKSEFEQLLKSR